MADYILENKPLTKREKQVLWLLTKGLNNIEIAQELDISIHTSKAHVTAIMAKLCAKSRLEAAIKAIKEGII